MRKNVVRVSDTSAVRKCATDLPSAADQWQPWESQAWLSLNERSLELVFAGQKLRFAKNKVAEPFFAASDNYMATWCEANFVADEGVELLVMPHQLAFERAGLPMAVPQVVAIDQWHSRFLLLFKRTAARLAPGDPMCQLLPVWRATTCVEPLAAADGARVKTHEEELAKTRPTRVVGGIDNRYEMCVKRHAPTPTRLCPIIFKRGY